MFSRLFLLFTVVPALEFYLLIQVGQVLGAGATVTLILLTGLLGAAMARSQGVAVLQRLQSEAAKGFPSGDRIVEALLILVGGVLLVTPGILTDDVVFGDPEIFETLLDESKAHVAKAQDLDPESDQADQHGFFLELDGENLPQA